MAVSPVNIDLTAETGALPQETFTDVAVVGTSDTAPPEAEFGEVNRYTSAADVSEDYGEGSDVHVAAQALVEEGTSEFYVLVLEETEHVDESVDSGTTLENTPALGEAGVTFDTRETVYTTDDPIDEADVDEGDAHVNTATGEIVTGDGTTATVTYSTVDWTLLERLENENVNRATLADVDSNRAHIGDLDAFVSWATGADVGVPIAIVNVGQFADDEEGMNVAHEVAGYVPSGNVIAVAHKASADVASHLLGKLATNDPWFNPYFDGDGFAFSSDGIRESLIGDPDTEGTFVGGDDDGNGPVNVVTTVGGVEVLWKSVSTAGAASNYQYFDVKMTEIFAASVIENALTSLRLREDRVPFTSTGRAMIGSTIRGALEEYTGGQTDPFAEIEVAVPSHESLTEDDRANRHWKGIDVEGRLSGDAHEFDLELTVTV